MTTSAPLSMGRVGSMLRRIAVRGIGIIAAVVVAEYGTRFVLAHGPKSDLPEHAVSAGPHVSINSLGYREREPGPKSPARFRIAVIGDSYTWGQALEARERFSNRLGELLGTRYEVLNCGVLGHTLPGHLMELDRVLKLEPDFVLLQMYINNFETPGMHRPAPYRLLPEKLDRQLGESYVVYRLLSDRWSQLQEAVNVIDGYDEYMERHLRDPESPSARESLGRLRQFFETARGADVPSGAVLFPAADAMGAFGTNYPFDYLHEHVKAVCADAHVPCLDLLPLFAALPDPRSSWVTPFDAHPNAETNRRVAAEILRTFAPFLEDGRRRQPKPRPGDGQNWK